MTNKDYINRAVDNEFETLYCRNLVKCYLYKSLLIDPVTQDTYTNRNIGHILCIDRNKVGDYLFQMKVFLGKGENPFLLHGFADKFHAVQAACEMYVIDRTMREFYVLSMTASQRVKKTRKEFINNYNLN